MYRCQICNTVVPPGNPAHEIVVETRPAVYPHRPGANRFLRKHKIEKRDDRGGSGSEIVRTVIACPRCAAR